MATSLDTEFQQAIKSIQDIYAQKNQLKDAEIAKLKQEIVKKDVEIQAKASKIQDLESHSSKLDQRMIEMTKAVSKLALFKQNLFDSLENGGLNEIDGFLNAPKPEANYKREHSFKQETNYKPETNYSLKHKESIEMKFPDPDTLTRDEWSASRMEGLSRYSTFSAPTSPLQKTQEAPTLSRSQTKREKRQNGSESLAPLDARAFFKDAKARLTYDQVSEFIKIMIDDKFTSLVWNVKAFNARQQTRAATLDNIAVLLGAKDQDLYERFEQMAGI